MDAPYGSSRGTHNYPSPNASRSHPHPHPHTQLAAIANPPRPRPPPHLHTHLAALPNPPRPRPPRALSIDLTQRAHPPFTSACALRLGLTLDSTTRADYAHQTCCARACSDGSSLLAFASFLAHICSGRGVASHRHRTWRRARGILRGCPPFRLPLKKPIENAGWGP